LSRAVLGSASTEIYTKNTGYASISTWENKGADMLSAVPGLDTAVFYRADLEYEHVAEVDITNPTLMSHLCNAIMPKLLYVHHYCY